MVKQYHVLHYVLICRAKFHDLLYQRPWIEVTFLLPSTFDRQILYVCELTRWRNFILYSLSFSDDLNLLTLNFGAIFSDFKKNR